MSRNYKIYDQTDLHYLTYATVGWVDVLTRPDYKDIIVESLRHCQREKGFELFAWCIMTNHVHLIARAKAGYQLQEILRDVGDARMIGRVHLDRGGPVIRSPEDAHADGLGGHGEPSQTGEEVDGGGHPMSPSGGAPKSNDSLTTVSLRPSAASRAFLTACR